MPIDKNINSHFDGINKDTVEVNNSNPSNAPVPTAMCGIIGFDRIEWGEKARALVDAVSNGENFDFCDLIEEIKKDCIYQIKCHKEDGMQFEFVQAIVFDKFLLLIKPVQFRNGNDKDTFMKAVVAVSEKIKKDFDAKPIFTFSYGEAWTFALRKTFGIRLGKATKNKDFMDNLIKSTFDEFGSIGDIPENHPAFKRFDIMMFFSQFNTQKGCGSIISTIPMDDSVVEELYEGEKAMPRSTLVEYHNTSTWKTEGRLVIDTKGYENIKFDISKFDGEHEEM
jgi:hypothetical protein